MFTVDDAWCFIHIPKTSGTNLKNIFPSNRVNYFDGIEYRNLFWEGYDYLFFKDYIPSIYGFYEQKHIPLSFWLKHKVIDLNYHKIFSIVRNPYTRILSWYNEIKRNITDFNFTFEQFLLDDYCNNLLKKLPYNCFSTTTNQLDFFIDLNGDIRINKFYKMESELQNLEKDFNISDINTHKYNSFSYNKNYKEIYTKDLIEWVQINFRRDFEYFEYDLNPFWI